MKYTKTVFAAAAALTLGACAAPYDPNAQYPANQPVSSTYPAYPAYPSAQNPDVARYGYVESVETVTAERGYTGPGIGAIGGAVAGGVLGNQVGSGSGNTAATIGGAVIGGVIGHTVEQRVRGNQAAGAEYVFRVRMDDGSYQTFRKETHDNIRVGDRVKVERNNIFLM
jgi:outer membrane lipoprotein SlyB